jgi:hypothetical protein
MRFFIRYEHIQHKAVAKKRFKFRLIFEKEYTVNIINMQENVFDIIKRPCCVFMMF